MLHYILIFFIYAGFLGTVFNLKEGYRADKNTVNWPPAVLFGGVYFILLTILYEKFLVYILLNMVNSLGTFLAFSTIGSGMYMVLFSFGTLALSKLTLCKSPDLWTYIVFVIGLIINVTLMFKVATLNYAEMVKNFGDAVFEDFYLSLSETTRTDTANKLLDLKWIVMCIPSVFYIIQIAKGLKKDLIYRHENI
ncbi:hypothetical protein SAMN02910369_02625 [Lachnospiraceae bacterium NE2001]|nr:hypothetical protein SAMN02910369_02625 [Lachnospiraceae bacterium NE2001]